MTNSIIISNNGKRKAIKYKYQWHFIEKNYIEVEGQEAEELKNIFTSTNFIFKQ